MKRPLNKMSKETELIDLFQEISAEQLLIEPKEMCPGELGSFNNEQWQQRLKQNVNVERENAQEEKVSLLMQKGIMDSGGRGGA